LNSSQIKKTPSTPSDNLSRPHIGVIRTVAEWASLREEWNALLAESPNNVPFLTYEFQHAWWAHLGGGEWQDAELHILLGREADGRLVGIAPLFRVQIEGQWTLQFIGTHQIADYLDIIVRPEDHARFTAAVIEHLAAADDWDRVELHNLLDSSTTLDVAKATADAAGLKTSHEMLQPSPHLILPASLDAYIDGLGSKQAHELRRKMRRAQRNAEPISFEFVDDGQFDAALEDFFQLMVKETNKAEFLHPAMRAQMEAIARGMFAAGWLQIIFLKAGNKRIAGYMNFDYDTSIWAYNAGFDPAYSALSPGWLIMVEMIDWCIKNGRRMFDFMRGGEEYKYRFGAVDRFVHKLVIERK
jgi:CelD/BcsL family acetyltransferase involved in cellulose biosynthesis